MTVYILMEEPPKEFGEVSIWGIYLDKEKAYKRRDQLKKKNPYMYQYIEVYPRRVIK